MRKILSLVIIFTIVLLFAGCDNTIPKTEFGLNEEAKIDDIEIKLINANLIENNILEAIFEIENDRGATITLDPDTNFKLYDINQVQVPNIYENNSNIVKDENKIIYTLQYNVSEKNIYEIYFYSGVVENNIKFTITNLDLE